MKYEPKNFSDLFATPMGADLWEYLQRPSVVLALEVATKLHRPAIEAIGDDLIGEFGEVVRSKRIKQLVGHIGELPRIVGVIAGDQSADHLVNQGAAVALLVHTGVMKRLPD